MLNSHCLNLKHFFVNPDTMQLDPDILMDLHLVKTWWADGVKLGTLLDESCLLVKTLDIGLNPSYWFKLWLLVYSLNIGLILEYWFQPWLLV